MMLKYMKSLLLLVIFISNTSQSGECDRSKCPWHRYGHYIAKECRPVYEGGSCCPTKFTCQTEAERGISQQECYYKGKKYQIGDVVPVKDLCSPDCRCRSGAQEGDLAIIQCAIVDCPSVFKDFKRGCRPLYDINRCCEIGEECSIAETRSAQCEWRNTTTDLGSFVDLGDENPCQVCVCTEDFKGPNGPGCRKVDCGFEFRYRRSLAMGCTPIYFETGCCGTGFMCPKDERLGRVNSPSRFRSDAGECALGDLVVPVGGSVQVSDCSIVCSCQTPPELTCIRYRTCRRARRSQRISNECADINCPRECKVTTASTSGCKQCFCPDQSYACPPPLCPPSCQNPTFEFDKSLGCSVCKCECKYFQGQPPCPQGCAVKLMYDQESGCEKCVCDSVASSADSGQTGGLLEKNVGKPRPQLPSFSFLPFLQPSIPEPPTSKADDICSLSPVLGDCRALFHRYAFSPRENKCRVFIYGGCGGNANNFLTLEDCRKKCGGIIPIIGECPAREVTRGETCINECNELYDARCVYKNQLCCSNGCANKCRDPIK